MPPCWWEVFDAKKEDIDGICFEVQELFTRPRVFLEDLMDQVARVKNPTYEPVMDTTRTLSSAKTTTTDAAAAAATTTAITSGASLSDAAGAATVGTLASDGGASRHHRSRDDPHYRHRRYGQDDASYRSFDRQRGDERRRDRDQFHDRDQHGDTDRDRYYKPKRSRSSADHRREDNGPQFHYRGQRHDKDYDERRQDLARDDYRERRDGRRGR